MALISSKVFVKTKLIIANWTRLSGFHMARKYKYLFGFSILFLIVWMQIGSLRKESLSSSSRDPISEALHKKLNEKPDKIRVKEYLDFDYKYDLKKTPKGESILDKIPRDNPPLNNNENNILINQVEEEVNYPKMRKRHQQSLNGVPISQFNEQFDVVGGVDLYPSEMLNQGYDEFSVDEAKVVDGAGENGDPVHLSPEEEEEGKKVMAKEAFNLVASDKMSLHRSVPETRDSQCLDIKYDKVLPKASVIIIFTNEAWTPLLRTIWSVLEKTPPEYLHEIILVDDFSDKKHLKGKLERYIQRKFPSKVRLKRLFKRSGLIRARLTGAELATGDVLLFLDSHCECGNDWIQPLLQRIKDEPKSFVVPIIDVIDDKTMEYYHSNGAYFQIGGFTWNGHFNWIDVPQHEIDRRGSPVAPTRTPTMAGGLFAVDRKYFWEVGSYDEEMDVWGGENLEMSFRVWQCGGILEIIPCSRVGHIFRSFHPYTFPGNKDTHGINTARTVEVWMDDYKRLFYMNRPDLLSTNIGDISKRMKFKEEKQCKSFQWYLDNIFPQKFVLDDPKHSLAYGRVRNEQDNLCFDTLQNDDKDSYELGLYPCHDFLSASQFFSFSRKNELRREDNCAQVDALHAEGYAPVRMSPCHGQGRDQDWTLTEHGRLINKATNMCLDTGNGGSSLYASPCKSIKSQKWRFDTYISE